MSRIKRSFKIIIAVIFILIIYISSSIWLSYNHLTVRTFPYTTSKVSAPLRIAVLADLHDNTFGEANEKLVDKVMEQSPDLVLLVGDFLNGNSKDDSVPMEFIDSLLKKCELPMYFAPGNHELEYQAAGHPDIFEKIKAAGIPVLDENFVDIKVGGEKLRLGGVYDYAFGSGPVYNEAALAKEEVKEFLYEFQDTDDLKIMMSHRPDSFIFGDAAKVWDIDLVVSGHLHGGQVVIPFLGGLYAGDQ